MIFGKVIKPNPTICFHNASQELMRMVGMVGICSFHQIQIHHIFFGNAIWNNQKIQVQIWNKQQKLIVVELGLQK